VKFFLFQNGKRRAEIEGANLAPEAPFQKSETAWRKPPFLKLGNSGASLASWDDFWRLRSAHWTIHLAKSFLSLKEQSRAEFGNSWQNEASHTWLKQVLPKKDFPLAFRSYLRSEPG